jgi:transcription-repair coupling factor (superfamily II helicase)
MNAVALPESRISEDSARLHGSSDALAFARLAQSQRPLVVFCAQATEAQRLKEEIAWFAPQLAVLLLPDWETLPYDHFSPHHDLVSERLATLYRIMREDFDVVLVPAPTALTRLAPPSYLAGRSFFIKTGEVLDLAALRSQLALAGYSHVTQVVAPGEFCVRGGLVDLFPMGSALPYRLDLIDKEIESIRSFDPDSQRTLYKVPEIRLLPAREFPLDEAGRTQFRRSFRERFDGDPTKRAVYKDVSNGVAPAGIEYYLPLFFEQGAALFDYMPKGATVAMHGQVQEALTEFWRDAQGRHQVLAGDRSRPVLSPAEIFLTAEEFFVRAKEFGRAGRGPTEASPLPDLAVERRAPDPLHRLKSFLARTPARAMLLAESAGRRETLLQYLAEYALKPELISGFEEFRRSTAKFALGVGPLLNGFALEAEGLAFVTESELYAGTARSRARDRKAGSSIEGMLRDLSELRAGDPVVHVQHGIGRYRGLVDLDLGDGAAEFLLIEYAEANKLYVPVAQLHSIGRYSGGPPEQAPLHKLGGDQWEKAKRKAARAVRDTAAELLDLYARRATRKGHAFKLNQHDYEAFVEGFGFEETPDQAAAIAAALENMKAGRPMDRLVCGDVGFGKTEVALRAAFVAVADGMQVAVLTPTTLLAEQHFNTFSDRFAHVANEWPVKIAELSRFRSGKETGAALAGLAAGNIDIAIGTHKLLQKDVKFKRLGLVIVDEEHRFGVRQKEALKALRAEVDVLTLTATPIPRTLAMSLEGLRDLSVIATAPERRLAIRTFVTPWSPAIIREAVLRELKRGGQIFFLHNDVATMEVMREKLEKLLPEARIAVAHGQMRERELERVMREFLQQRSNLLLCSTIIETGIDISTANTILIERADKFGLAQLHQLRGRVGRSHHQAYAYLLTPGEDALSAAAKKRLEAIQMMEELGSGFYLAMQDLEIRGAGEVLGESQSGEMQEVGFNLYADMLDHAVRSLKAGREPDLSQPFEVTTEVNLHFPALLPAAYCADVHERLVLYKRFANCDTGERLEGMQEELVDRFGDLPPAARALIESHRLRLLGKPLGVARVDATAETIQIQFVPHPPLDPAAVLKLVQKHKWKLAGPTKLRVDRVTSELPERAAAVRQVLDGLRTAVLERLV